MDWRAPVHSYRLGAEKEASTRDDGDDAWGVPRSVVVDDAFDWGDDRRPEHLWRRTILYELHVKGFTARHPGVPKELRGTFAGLAHPAALEHLQRLGVTSVELLPVHEAVDEGFLVKRELTNYWGYNTLGYFAPDQRFSSQGSRGGQVREFKQLVKALHSAGLEVILDVVYNHSCEGSHLGPTLCFRGLDNPAYYWLSPEDASRYEDFTGCGNSLNAKHAMVQKLIADSMRYWVTEMHVDGFRVDLATTLGREAKGDFDPDGAFFDVVNQDPVLSRVKLIAEPWDVGREGFKLANFPVLWAEWNNRYRETLRRYWKGDDRQAAEIGYRMTGSSDLFKVSGRRPTASINYVAVHDGFTLHDLVSYDKKHNEANGEGNRDGGDDNFSWNCGVEGDSDDPVILSLRERQKRNLLASLFCSVGTPMLSAGDELGRTQKGNNNGYCQDNQISWLDWELDDRARQLLEFTTRMIHLRKAQPVLQRRHFFQGSTIGDSRFKDLVWFRPDGEEMTPADWAMPFARSLAYLLGGDAIAARDNQGRLITGDSLLVLMNAHHEAVEFTLPALKWGPEWDIIVDTARAEPIHGRAPAGGRLELTGRSMTVLRHAP